jgi:hypothetical protein
VGLGGRVGLDHDGAVIGIRPRIPPAISIRVYDLEPDGFGRSIAPILLEDRQSRRSDTSTAKGWRKAIPLSSSAKNCFCASRLAWISTVPKPASVSDGGKGAASALPDRLP